MEVSRRKSGPRNVVAGSVWESRMKMDEVKGGIKVFNGGEKHIEESNNVDEGGDVLVLPMNKSLETNNQSTVVREKRRTWKAEPVEVIGSSPIQPNKFTSKSYKELSASSVDGIDKSPILIKHTRSVSHKDFNETCKDFGVCKEKTSSSSLSSLDCEEDEGEEGREEKVVENKSFDVKEVDVLEQKPNKVVREEKKVNHQIYRKSNSISPNVKKLPPLFRDSPLIEQEVKKPPPITLAEQPERFPEKQSKLQSFVDLVMWKDISKSAFIFGLGTFILISSSYTEDLDLSLISVISYMGLVYLAAIFVYKSVLCRGVTDVENSIHLVGEEEAIWLLKLILPYLNETLLELKAIFSGDPATTMKLAVLLFVLARCGSFITISKMVKLGFFGVFTLPKICSSYSAILPSSCKFWIQHSRDTWHSFTQKKVVAVVVFILLWKFSSMLTRIWAVFMLVVVVKYYQQSSREVEEQVEVEDNSKTNHGGRRQRQGVWASRVNPVKEKKES
ncbi:hypothetical protein IFM89_007123 [Coptis chinensis]|uniref:Reticulon-like protein n=1 Tax=Coptis chinensis TaxID=261450 RepID=A0A835HBM4_9MAGN|nr:hypothetical protein IFM89_007123 [Coptis chinensis]